MAAVLVLVAGCASEDAATPSTAASETDTGPSPELGPATDTTAEPAVDPCMLVSDETLAEIFPTGAPEPDGTDYGGGFSDCTWDAPDVFLGVTLVPEGEFASQFADELGLGAPVRSDKLGPDAVSFHATARLGSAPSDGGATVAFVKDGTRALVAVRSSEGGPSNVGTTRLSGEDGGPSDLGTATQIAEEVVDGL